MAKNLVTTYNPEDATSYIGFFKSLKRIYDINEERCVPVIVINVYDDDEKKGMIEVRPIIQNTYKNTDNAFVYQDRASFMVRPLRIAQGGCILNMPIHIGDTGWVIAGDRDAKDAIESNSEFNVKDKEEDELEECTYPPTSFEILKCEFGFFIPSGWFKEITNKDLSERLALIVADENGERAGSLSLSREGMTYINGKGEDGEEFEAHIQDTDIVTGVDEENRCLKTWHGKVLRTDGEEGPLIKIDEISDGWDGEIREATDIRYEPDKSICSCLYVTKKYKGGILKELIPDEQRTVIFQTAMHLPEDY